MDSIFIKDQKYEAAHDKTYKIAYARSEGLDQPGHPPSLISLHYPHEKKKNKKKKKKLGSLTTRWAHSEDR